MRWTAWMIALALTGAGLHAARAEETTHGDAAMGEKIFARCRACHQVGETAKTLIGPELNGVVSRKAGSLPNYRYSEAMKNAGLTWDEATFRDFIRNPKAKVPGTSMAFPGLSRDKDIDDLTAYLKQYAPDGRKS